MFEKLIPYDTAHIILGAYMNYYHHYKRITKRAKIRFEARDWPGIQADARERSLLYRDAVGETTNRVREFLGKRKQKDLIWQQTKYTYLEDILNFNTRNIAETFYNSVFRHMHKEISADEECMFVHATSTYREFKSIHPIFNTFYLGKPVEPVIRHLFSYYSFDAPFEDLERDISNISTKLDKLISNAGKLSGNSRLEVLKSIFFRNKGAYIVGRLILGDRLLPFVLPLLHQENGIHVDAVLLESNDVSSIFSYNRSYFLVDVDIVSEMVDFLKSILPTKSLGELYNSIGFEKHGKTVFYRDFLRHLQSSDDQFVVAPGVRGMVMAVFTLPSYGMVFKLIKDRFAPPKNVTEDEVKEKYELVNQHDRVGRMTDSHMFQNLVLARHRFNEELLAELVKDAPSKVIVGKDTVEIKHLYVEKRMVPLDIYLDKASPRQAKTVINEYGLAIKQMAAVNIFPGDMLLKNFGVTRLNRVVFYDYDEIGFLTDYNFRIIPEPRDDYEAFSKDPYFHVSPEDIFPEEFPRFLIGRKDIRELFIKMHGDLFGIRFWKRMQKRLRKGEIIDVFPYSKKLRFKRSKKKVEKQRGKKTSRQKARKKGSDLLDHK
ncbi:MAG: bifunctional isocitrate dehydrogenase kinase/phosphatase [Bacteroidota bacterium]